MSIRHIKTSLQEASVALDMPLAKGDYIIAAAPSAWEDLNAIVTAAEKED